MLIYLSILFYFEYLDIIFQQLLNYIIVCLFFHFLYFLCNLQVQNLFFALDKKN